MPTSTENRINKIQRAPWLRANQPIICRDGTTRENGSDPMAGSLRVACEVVKLPVRSCFVPHGAAELLAQQDPKELWKIDHGDQRNGHFEPFIGSREPSAFRDPTA